MVAEETISQVSSTTEEKAVLNNKIYTNYVLKRSDITTVKSMFVSKNDDRVAYRIEKSSNVKDFLKNLVISYQVIPVIILSIMLYLINLAIYIPVIVFLYAFFSWTGRSIKYLVFTESDNKIGTMRSSFKYFNFKPALLGKNWKFTTTDPKNKKLFLHFPTEFEGLLTDSQNSFTLLASHNRADKQYYSGLSKIEALDESNTTVLSINLPEMTTEWRGPPRILEISASESFNELSVVFLVVMIISKYFVIAD